MLGRFQESARSSIARTSMTNSRSRALHRSLRFWPRRVDGAVPHTPDTIVRAISRQESFASANPSSSSSQTNHLSKHFSSSTTLLVFCTPLFLHRSFYTVVVVAMPTIVKRTNCTCFLLHHHARAFVQPSS